MSGNANMLDTGLLYEAMKAARPVVAAHHSPGGTSPTPSALPPSPTAAYDSENNLNKSSGTGDKGYADKHVLNIDKDNYMLKRGPLLRPSAISSTSTSTCTTSTTTTTSTCTSTSSTTDLLFSQSNVLTCVCRGHCPGSGCHSHTVSSLLPLLECRACFHNVCSSFSSVYSCSRPHHNPGPTYPVDVPISQWSTNNVVDWMAALNLAPYTDVFRSKEIKGADLLSLDKDTLVKMGIKDEFHQKAILVCVDQLQGEGRDAGGGGLERAGAASGSECTTPASHHNLHNYSFNDLQCCDKCGLFLRGLIQQGQFCRDCGLVTHRTCAATGLPPCVQQSSKCFRRLLLSSVFGLSLCTQFSPSEAPAPLLLVRCCQELVYWAKSSPNLDPYHLYCTPAHQEALTQLRQDCDKDVCGVELSGYEPHVIACLVKRYLRELPETVLPETLYDKFMEAARISNDDQCAKCLSQLVKELNPHHLSTLQFVMEHLLQLCLVQVGRGNRDYPKTLVQSMAHVLIRPPWEKVMDLARNTDAHVRVIEILLTKVEWGVEVPTFVPLPALPPRISKLAPNPGIEKDPSPPPPLPPPAALPYQSNIPSSAPKALREAEWYWGSITREDANILMKDKKDGTFLVRDASTGNNEYTLTLRKGGSNKLIKICHRNGKYGFSEPYMFNSVVELVNYCCQQSLIQFNKALDIRLLHPVNRTHGEESEGAKMRVEDILSRLSELNKQYIAKTGQYNSTFEKQQGLVQELQGSKQALDSLVETIAIFEDHLKMHEKFKKEAQPHEIQDMVKNKQVLVTRLEKVQEVWRDHDFRVTNLKMELKAMERKSNALTLDVRKLAKQMDQYKSSLLSRGLSADMMEQWLEQLEPQQKPQLCPDLYNMSTWYFENCSREMAMNLLRDKADGTFLIRTARNGGYALSIACNKGVQHCKIYEDEQGYGFAEPFLIYPTLQDLVLHYSENSLLMHNDLLNTPLTFPALMNS